MYGKLIFDLIMSIPCGIGNCEKSFDANHIARHRSTHLEKKISCENCEEKFANKEYLKRHIKQRHLKEVKLCEHCGRSFSNPSLLTRHKAVRNKYQFACVHCCMSFKLPSNLQDHLHTVHSEITDPEINVNYNLSSSY